MEYLDFAFTSMLRLFALLSPFSAAAVFISITKDDSLKERVHIAKIACSLSALILIVFALTGKIFFVIFDVSEASFRIAGGIVLFAVGFDMLRAREPEENITEEEQRDAVKLSSTEVAITPLAIPLLAGPGTITGTVIFQTEATTWIATAVLCGVICLCLFFNYWFFRFCLAVTGVLSPFIFKVAHRLFGLVLAALATQIILVGLEQVELIRLPKEETLEIASVDSQGERPIEAEVPYFEMSVS